MSMNGQGFNNGRYAPAPYAGPRGKSLSFRRRADLMADKKQQVAASAARENSKNISTGPATIRRFSWEPTP